MGLIPSGVRASSRLTCVQKARWGAPGHLWTHVEVSLLARAGGGAEGPGCLSQWENRTRGGGFLEGAASFPRTARRLRAGVCKTLREHEEGQFCHPSRSGGERSRAGPRPRPGRGWAASGQMVVSTWAQGHPQPGARCPVREARSRPEGSGGEGPPKSRAVLLDACPVGGRQMGLGSRPPAQAEGLAVGWRAFHPDRRARCRAGSVNQPAPHRPRASVG